MEQKTTLEELLERPRQKDEYEKRFEEACRLSAAGRYDEADAIFDELLGKRPDDVSVASARRINARRKSLDDRIAAVSLKSKETRCGKRRERGLAVFRSSKVLTAIVVAFFIVCAAAAVMIADDGGTPAPEPELQSTAVGN